MCEEPHTVKPNTWHWLVRITPWAATVTIPNGQTALHLFRFRSKCFLMLARSAARSTYTHTTCHLNPSTSLSAPLHAQWSNHKAAYARRKEGQLGLGRGFWGWVWALYGIAKGLAKSTAHPSTSPTSCRFQRLDLPVCAERCVKSDGTQSARASIPRGANVFPFWVVYCSPQAESSTYPTRNYIKSLLLSISAWSGEFAKKAPDELWPPTSCRPASQIPHQNVTIVSHSLNMPQSNDGSCLSPCVFLPLTEEILLEPACITNPNTLPCVSGLP